ncbi:hypothetical protein H4219_003630 [Mycoemilia scoparia]|uniref:Uncharacterized protein n=1 Tax=Mycoemilia scoparia TaxID=417184 RepID=A0A9W8DT33_9FUNG|nr:hypothetical protein H4219_003630 [Mycoemilia scoparia]
MILDHVDLDLNPGPSASSPSSSGNSNISRLTSLKLDIERINVVICGQQPILKERLEEYSWLVTLVLYKFACYHIVKEITAIDDTSLFHQLMKCGEDSISESIRFVRALHHSDGDFSEQEQQQALGSEPTAPNEAAALLEEFHEFLDSEEKFGGIIYHASQYYCGLVMLTCAFLFWSTAFPGDAGFPEQYSGIFQTIDEASKLYHELLVDPSESPTDSDDDDNSHPDQDNAMDVSIDPVSSVHGDEADLSEDEAEDDDDEDLSEDEANDEDEEMGDNEDPLGAISVAMFIKATQKHEIIQQISDYLAETGCLETIPLSDHEAEDGYGMHIKGIGGTPLDPSIWADDLQAARYFSYDSIMHRMKSYKQASQNSYVYHTFYRLQVQTGVFIIN